MNNKHVQLGKYLKSARLKAGLSQHFVSKKLSLTSPQFVSNFERGLCSPPLKQLKKLVTLYKIPPQEIIELLIQEQTALLHSVLLFPSKKKKSS